MTTNQRRQSRKLSRPYGGKPRYWKKKPVGQEKPEFIIPKRRYIEAPRLEWIIGIRENFKYGKKTAIALAAITTAAILALAIV